MSRALADQHLRPFENRRCRFPIGQLNFDHCALEVATGKLVGVGRLLVEARLYRIQGIWVVPVLS